MKQKIYTIGAILPVLITLGVLFFFLDIKKENISEKKEQTPAQEIKIKPTSEKKSVKVSEQQEPAKLQRYDLMDESTYSLSTIIEFAKLPGEIKNTIKAQVESYQNVYTAYQKDGNLILIVQEPISEKPYSRHGMKKVVISTLDGSIEEHSLGLENADEDSELDMWQYAKVSGQKLPVKHTKYDENKEIEYVEYWNYNPEEDIKYEVKDQFGNPVSIMKETLENDSNLRQEHIFYDSEGNTKLNISASYEGPNIVRFTYFNSDNSDNNITSISEYQDGLKTKESVYNSDYKLKNVYTSAYDDGVRKDITVFDSNKNEVDKLLSKE